MFIKVNADGAETATIGMYECRANSNLDDGMLGRIDSNEDNEVFPLR